MASASVTLENQLHSAQKNLLFLQQDHANTLKGLHAEIRRLQQHCTDLTYELTVRRSDPSDSGEARCRELQRRCEELEEALKAREEENAELQRELEQKSAMISVLEDTLRERERKYLDELKLKSHRLAVLSGELEQRASTIAYLTSQLHATKKRLMAGAAAAAAASGGSGGSDGSDPASSYKPSPPPAPPQAGRDGRRPETPRRRMRKSLSQPLHSEYAELYRLGSDGHRVVLREPLDAMPDPTPFLQARESPESALAHVVRPALIPPIASDRSSSASSSGAAAAMAPPALLSSPAHGPAPPSPRDSPARERTHLRGNTHVGVAHRIHRSPSTGGGAAGGGASGGGAARVQAEFETLAVDQVNGPEKVVRKRSGTDRTV